MNAAKDTHTGFSEEERTAMKQRAAELKEQRSGGTKVKQLEKDRKAVQDAIAQLPDEDRALAEAIHEIVISVAPELDPKTYYGMPAYARDGKVMIFFSPATKFKERYASLGFNPNANLDDGNMWPTTFAVLKMTNAEKKRISELVEQAVS
ncbi:iron chaperone [Microbacterium immunditiarum]|uniref:Uncharacterized protein YdhG (YjbR/CyaY superfamily) n=1 Tax=Microbacterium immunditiarum TaxID=337480 RepID=A0A7Y9KKZ5_9MICO|nr:hypothetical protein [Microbacterium immunditiarum]NYE19688.1 uncharacterized protein YdhG (YjbR/CyaY superfamily) [Microbacterium immunditiarum]